MDRRAGKVMAKGNVCGSYDELVSIITRNMQGRRVTKRAGGRQNTTAAFEERYARREWRRTTAAFEEIPAYRKAKDTGDDCEWIRLQREILRAERRKFLATAVKGYLRRVFQYLAQKDGRTQPHLRPAWLDPIRYEGQLIAEAQKKAEILAQHFAKKLTMGAETATNADNTVWAAI